MGNTFAFAGRTGMFLMACVAAITVSSCSNDGIDPNIQELEKRGFTDIVPSNDHAYPNIYFGSVGSCRIRLVYDSVRSTWTAQNGKDDNGPTKVDNPTADAIRATSAYDYCSKQSTPSVSPTPTS